MTLLVCAINCYCAQVVEFPDVEGPLQFGYDEEWMGVLQATHHLMSTNRHQTPLPGKLKQCMQCVNTVDTRLWPYLVSS